MAEKNWLTSFTGTDPVQDPDPITNVMPDLNDVSAPGAADGDDALSSQPEALRDKLDTVCKIVGDSLKLPAGAICDILDRDHSTGEAGWLRLGERTSAPTGAAGKVYFYALDDGGTSKAYVKWSDDTQVEIGSGGGQTNTVAGATGITNTGTNVDAVLAPTYGSSADTICEGDDARLSDARTPTGAASGDLTGTYPGPTVTTGAIDNTKLADMAQATIKGRASGAGTGDPVDLTAAQATAILDVFTSGAKGLVPASGGGTTNFLRADGSFAAPGGGGSATNLWRYMTATDLPTGATAPEAVWRADSLSDQTANGHDLTVEGGTAAYSAIEGLKGFSSEHSFRLDVANPTGLISTGAVTAAFLAAPARDIGQAIFFSNAGQSSPESEIYNPTVFFYVNAYTFHSFTEYGAGNNITVNFDAGPAFGPLQHIVFTRSSDSLTYKVYVDGVLVDTQTASFAPTGGTSAPAKLMGQYITNAYRGIWCSGLITMEEWSAAQVLEHYQFCRRLV